MDDHDRLEGMTVVRSQTRRDFRRGNAPPPATRHVLDLKAEFFRYPAPEVGKVPRLEDEDTDPPEKAY